MDVLQTTKAYITCLIKLMSFIDRVHYNAKASLSHNQLVAISTNQVTPYLKTSHTAYILQALMIAPTSWGHPPLHFIKGRLPVHSTLQYAMGWHLSTSQTMLSQHERIWGKTAGGINRGKTCTWVGEVFPWLSLLDIFTLFFIAVLSLQW